MAKRSRKEEEPKTGVGMIIKLVSVLMFAVGVWYFVVYLPAQKKSVQTSEELQGQVVGETGQKKNVAGPAGEKAPVPEAEFGKFKAFSFAPHEQYERGEILDEDYIESYTYGDVEVELGEEEYYLLGDNRLHSYDSRHIGSIEESAIIGRAWFRGLPVDRISTFELPDYQDLN